MYSTIRSLSEELSFQNHDTLPKRAQLYCSFSQLSLCDSRHVKRVSEAVTLRLVEMERANLEKPVPACVMDLMPVSLDKVIYRESSPEWWDDSYRAQAVAEIAYGMQYLHSLGIIHGNLRPSNILLNDNHHACITDFGSSVIDDDIQTSRVRT